MKKLITLFVLLVSSAGLFAQSPVLHYKFLITDNGSPVTTAVDLKFRIKDGSTVLWEEEHTGVVPDANGIASIEVGTGNQTGGSLSSIDEVDWSLSLTYDVDVNTGGGYAAMVSDEAFLYVPKAKYAEHADFNGLDNKPVTFLLSGSTDYPTQITDEIYHTGKASIGTDAPAGNASLYVLNAENGGQNGLKAEIDAPDNANKTAAFHVIDNAGDGYLKATANKISAAGNGTHVGTWTQLDGSGSGSHVGTYNRMFGDGSGYQTGIMNEIRNTSDNYQIAVYNWITNNGNGEHYGVVSTLEGGGNGVQVGSAISIYNTGSGDKYGSYVYIDPNIPGTHYGVYSDASGDSHYAGFFNGNVNITGELQSPLTGDADLKPLIYGQVSAAGNRDGDSSTLGFTVSGSAGHYTVTFDSALPDASYIVEASIEGSDFGLIRVVKSSTGFDVYTADASGTQAARDFSFVVYRR